MEPNGSSISTGYSNADVGRGAEPSYARDHPRASWPSDGRVDRIGLAAGRFPAVGAAVNDCAVSGGTLRI